MKSWMCFACTKGSGVSVRAALASRPRTARLGQGPGGRRVGCLGVVPLRKMVREELPVEGHGDARGKQVCCGLSGRSPRGRPHGAVLTGPGRPA